MEEKSSLSRESLNKPVMGMKRIFFNRSKIVYARFKERYFHAGIR